MKRYVPIIIGIVALCAVLYVGNIEMKNRRALAVDEQKSDISSKSFQSKVIKNFEGEHALEYGFDIPETGTTTLEKDGALAKVFSNAEMVTALYVSYEGGRGYSPADYITNVIVPHVAAITDAGTTTLGAYDWTVVESQWSVWHVAQTADKQWLLVVENKKTQSEAAGQIIESIVTK
jgi:hypothetical protein